MDGIAKCTKPDEVFQLSIDVRVMCSSRDHHLMGWLTWIGTLRTTLTETEVYRWSNGIEHETEIMAEDVWDILTVKVASPLSAAIYHAMIKGGSALTRSTRAWYTLYRDSRGRVVDRTSHLSDRINAPVRLKDWKDVALRFRTWEIEVAEFESITGAPMEKSLQATALLRMLPLDLRDKVLSQDGIEGDFDRIRDYVLNQVGRHAAEAKTT